MSRRDDRVTVILSREELARLQAAAAAEHMALSAWFRALGLRRAERVLPSQGGAQ